VVWKGAGRFSIGFLFCVADVRKKKSGEGLRFPHSKVGFGSWPPFEKWPAAYCWLDLGSWLGGKLQGQDKEGGFGGGCKIIARFGC